MQMSMAGVVVIGAAPATAEESAGLQQPRPPDSSQPRAPPAFAVAAPRFGTGIPWPNLPHQ